MSSQIRTALVGFGVIAVCIAMASLKGHYLLMVFAAASLWGGIWTWKQHSRKPLEKQPLVSSSVARRRRSSNSQNVYPFPAAQHWNVSDASGS